MAEDSKAPLRPGETVSAAPAAPPEEKVELPEGLTTSSPLDNLREMGGLEVATMPESNELQERRRKTKNRLQELSNMGPDGEKGEDSTFGEEDESGFMDLLKEANLSTRHLKFCCSGLFLVGLLIALIFGGRAFWQWWKDRPEDAGTEEEVPEDTPTEPEEESDFFLDDSLLSGILVGEETAEDDPATEVGESLGDSLAGGGDLGVFIRDFSSVYNALQVEVNGMLNQSTDRYDALQEYQNELAGLQGTAERNLERLTEERDALVEEFTAVDEAKAEQEDRFFTALEELNPAGAESALNAFIAHGENLVFLRAQFNAREKLISYYEQALEELDLRIRDIELNEEALVKGVQVVDIEGSNLNLILREDEL
ncbi:MAG: hypothetical protein WC777_04725 [Candidatus Gracilibacteria bacterium]|jgi:hypothetical protein